MVVDSFRSATVSLEPYVDSIVAGKFLGLHPVTVMRLARQGHLPGYPERHTTRRQCASYSRHSVAGSHGGPVPRKKQAIRQTRQVRPSPDLH
jgi:hypothetical protein